MIAYNQTDNLTLKPKAEEGKVVIIDISNRWIPPIMDKIAGLFIKEAVVCDSLLAVEEEVITDSINEKRC